MEPCSVPLVPTLPFLFVPNVTGLFVQNVTFMEGNIAVGQEDIVMHYKFETN
jgi:hypothetical protein